MTSQTDTSRLPVGLIALLSACNFVIGRGAIYVGTASGSALGALGHLLWTHRAANPRAARQSNFQSAGTKL
ncbi:hypothetical protein GCM10011363_03950 [Marivita lacus]|uniref:Uncharacterized protein n=1 Tax=Marivita lacus TaxID=1323742 RepID=A0ABQ1K8Y8_9RHOB|nr:hypothetical protein [Marivita lacus]GGB90549.1 hypothetical protein GCM10011363_03950 [Marivita lacus]